jgi:glycosyltransferase involved in cell wall biosynthesis
MGKIKVLHIVEAAGGGGGVFTFMKELSIFFGKQMGKMHTTIIFSMERTRDLSLNLNKEFANGVSLQEMKIKGEISLFNDIKSIYHLVKIYKKEQPQIIHLHSSKAGALGRIAGFFYKKATIFYTPHGYSFLRQDISPLKRKLFYAIEKYIVKFFGGTTIACGDSELEYATKIGNSLLVRNGTNVNDIISQNIVSKQSSKNLIIGIIGRITYAKNPWLFNQIAKNNPNLNFIWIGDGELRDIITSPNIMITGWLERNKIFDYLNKLDIYIQTSLWEGLPIAPLEAMALKKPILATNIVGNKDIVVHGYTGYLFNDDKDVQEYIDKLKDEELRTQIGEAGFKRCKEVFDLNSNFNSLMNIYFETVKNNTPKNI